MVQSSDALNTNNSRRLENILRMCTERLLYLILLSEVSKGWKMVRGGKSMTWVETVKAVASGLAR